MGNLVYKDDAPTALRCCGNLPAWLSGFERLYPIQASVFAGGGRLLPAQERAVGQRCRLHEHITGDMAFRLEAGIVTEYLAPGVPLDPLCASEYRLAENRVEGLAND